MEKIYYLKFKDELVGKIYYPSCKFEKDPTWNEALPSILAPSKSNSDYQPSDKEVLLFLEDRIRSLFKYKFLNKLSGQDKLKILESRWNNQSINNVIENYGTTLESLLDSSLGMGIKDYYWLLTENKLHLDFESYHPRAEFDIGVANGEMFYRTIPKKYFE